MNEVKHTPGPWQVQAMEFSADHPDYGVAYVIGENLGGLVGAALPWPTELDNGAFSRVEANARLIAAAPEMLEALRKLAAEVGGLRAFEAEMRAELGNTNWSVLMKRLADADATIAKAEGRS